MKLQANFAHQKEVFAPKIEPRFVCFGLSFLEDKLKGNKLQKFHTKKQFLLLFLIFIEN
jgi:hypothetical protein